MDPISLIITALSSAAIAAVTGTAHGVSQGLAQGGADEAYHHLKALIKRKFAGEPKA